MIDHAENPIGRLYLFMTHCRGMPNSTCLRAWTQYFGIEERYGPELWRAIAVLIELPGQARAVIGRFGGNLDSDTVLEQLDRAQSSLDVAANLGQNMSAMLGHYDLGTLMALQLASSVIGPTHVEPIASPESRDSIREAANDLIKTLQMDDTIPNEVKRVLFEHAEAILHALNLVSIGGAGLIVEERNRLFGRLASDPLVADTARKNPNIRGKIVALLNTIMLIGNVAQLGLQLPQDIAADLALTQGPATVIAPAAIDAAPTDTA